MKKLPFRVFRTLHLTFERQHFPLAVIASRNYHLNTGPWRPGLFSSSVLNRSPKLSPHLWTFLWFSWYSRDASSLCYLPAVLFSSHSLMFPGIIRAHPDTLQQKVTNSNPRIAALWGFFAWLVMSLYSSWYSSSCQCPKVLRTILKFLAQETFGPRLWPCWSPLPSPRLPSPSQPLYLTLPQFPWIELPFLFTMAYRISVGTS